MNMKSFLRKMMFWIIAVIIIGSLLVLAISTAWDNLKLWDASTPSFEKHIAEKERLKSENQTLRMEMGKLVQVTVKELGKLKEELEKQKKLNQELLRQISKKPKEIPEPMYQTNHNTVPPRQSMEPQPQDQNQPQEVNEEEANQTQHESDDPCFKYMANPEKYRTCRVWLQLPVPQN